jgi:hypothetical protein
MDRVAHQTNKNMSSKRQHTFSYCTRYITNQQYFVPLLILHYCDLYSEVIISHHIKRQLVKRITLILMFVRRVLIKSLDTVVIIIVTWVPFTMVWHFNGLKMEKTASRYEGQLRIC